MLSGYVHLHSKVVNGADREMKIILKMQFHKQKTSPRRAIDILFYRLLMHDSAALKGMQSKLIARLMTLIRVCHP